MGVTSVSACKAQEVHSGRGCIFSPTKSTPVLRHCRVKVRVIYFKHALTIQQSIADSSHTIWETGASTLLLSVQHVLEMRFCYALKFVSRPRHRFLVTSASNRPHCTFTKLGVFEHP